MTGAILTKPRKTKSFRLRCEADWLAELNIFAWQRRMDSSDVVRAAVTLYVREKTNSREPSIDDARV